MKCSFSIQNVHGISSEIFYFFDFSLQKKKKKLTAPFFTIVRTFTITTTRRKTYPGALSILNNEEFCFVDSHQFGITLKLDYHFPPWPED